MNDHAPQAHNAQLWAALNAGIQRAAGEKGYRLRRRPGRGRSNVWDMERGGKSYVASFRTTQDRWFAFPPLNGGARFKTLENVDLVFVGAVDDRDDPKMVEVYEFPADDVRQRFSAAYSARRNARLTVRDNFGMWINLDEDKRGIAASVGSGLAESYAPIAKYSIRDLIEEGVNIDVEDVDDHGDESGSRMPRLTTISDVLANARESIAAIAGVPPSAVRLDLKIES